MKQIKHLRNKFKLPFVAALSFALVGLGLWQYVHAAPNQIYLSPGSASVQNGNNTTTSLRVTPGTPIDGIEATITYDQSKLQFVSIDSSASAFNAQLSQSGGGGTVNIIRGSLSGTIAGDSLVASITFKALAGSGTTPLSVTGNTSSGGSYTNPSVVGATITLTSPSTPTNPTTPTTPSTPSSPSTPPTPSTPSTGTSTPKTSTPSSPSTPDNPAPSAQTETGLQVEKKRIEFNNAILTTKASKSISVYCIFGTDPAQLQSATTATAFGTDHDIKLDGQLVTPGLTYYFKVIAKDEQGNISEGAVETFKTKGYTVKMAVKDANGSPLKKRKFTLHSDPATGQTDDSGAMTFTDVAPGDHQLEYEQGGKVYSETITIASTPISEAADGTQTAEAQELPVVFAQLKSSRSGIPVILPITIVILLVGAVAGAFIFVKRKNQMLFAPSRQPAFTPTATSDAQTKTTDQLVTEAHGVDRPDPGSVVSPKQKQ